MLKRNLSILKKTAILRPFGYLEDVLNHAVEINEEENWYILTDEDFYKLSEKYKNIKNHTNKSDPDYQLESISSNLSYFKKDDILNINLYPNLYQQHQKDHGIKGGQSYVTLISDNIYFGPIGSFDFYMAHKDRGEWYLQIWSKSYEECEGHSLYYAEINNFKPQKINDKLSGSYDIPIYHICNNDEKQCGELKLMFN